MKTMRRCLLLYSLAGCWVMMALPPNVAAGGEDDSIFSPTAALRGERKVLSAEPLVPPPEVDSKKTPEVRCKYLITVADDFVVEVYHNGKPVPDTERELLVERFGATAEKVQVAIRTGDWLVFHVVQNRLRWG